MKASDLIARLKELQKTVGDVDIMIPNVMNGDFEPKTVPCQGAIREEFKKKTIIYLVGYEK